MLRLISGSPADPYTTQMLWNDHPVEFRKFSVHPPVWPLTHRHPPQAPLVITLHAIQSRIKNSYPDPSNPPS